MKKLFLIDGSGFIFRAFYALPPLTNPEGVPINAVYGYCNMILKEKTNYNKYVNQIIYFYKIFDLAYKSSKNNKAEYYK